MTGLIGKSRRHESEGQNLLAESVSDLRGALVQFILEFKSNFHAFSLSVFFFILLFFPFIRVFWDLSGRFNRELVNS
jgi:hypothetical protein